MVDQLAREFADDPVVFLEYDVDNPPGDRISRWWVAWGNGGSATLPLIMVDSGQQLGGGYESFYQVYRAMVEAELQRAPRAKIEVSRERVGNSFRFEIELTNLSDVTLNSTIGAKVHAIVYEEIHYADTGRWVRAAADQPISSLAPGQTKSYTIEVPVQGVDWDKVHSVVLADYRPDGPSGIFDTLQAVHQ